VEVQRREPADLVVFGVVAAEVLELDGAERPAGVGAGLGETVRRDRADETAAVRIGQPAGTDARIDPRRRVGDLGQRRRRRLIAARGE
jgi:hypothetical protein